MRLSAYYACIRVISEDVAKLPVHVYRRLIPRGKEALYDHPVYLLLHDAPNPEQTAYTFRETMTQWALGWGNGYAEIVRDGTGRPRELWPIHPSRVRVMRNDAGRLIYRVASESDPDSLRPQPSYVDLLPADVLHIKGMGNGRVGYSIAAYGAESIGLGLAAETFGATFFGQGSTASGVLTHPALLSETARTNLRNSWQKTYGGAKNSHKLAILEEGLKWEQITIPPDEAQFLETRQFQVEEICRWFRVAPHKIQHLLRSTFTNIEQQSIEHVTDTLLPWLVRWEQECKRSLIVDEPRLYIAHNVNGLLRGDANARSNWYRTMVNIGAMSPNDVREYEDENPISGPAGDEYFMQTNMSTLKRIASGQTTAAAPAPARQQAPSDDDTAEMAERRTQFLAQAEALGPAFVAEADRVLRKEAMAVTRAQGKPNVAAWAETFFREQSEYMVSAMEPLLSDLCRMGADVLGRPMAQPDLAGFARTFCDEARTLVAQGSPLPDSHTPQALAQAVMALSFDVYPEGRP